MEPPRSLDEAIARILPLSKSELDALFVLQAPFDAGAAPLTPTDIAVIQSHFFLGARIRFELGLWGTWNSDFIRQLTDAVPEYPFLDADGASTAMVLLLRKISDGEQSTPVAQ